MHRSTMEGIDDMIMLTELHESSLLHNLRVRYLQDKIYVHASAHSHTARGRQHGLMGTLGMRGGDHRRTRARFWWP